MEEIEKYNGKASKVNRLEKELEALSVELSWIKPEDRNITATWNLENRAELQMHLVECIVAKVLYDLNPADTDNPIGIALTGASMEAVAICSTDFFYKNYKKRYGRMKALKNYPEIANRLLSIAVDAAFSNAKPSDSISAVKQFMEITDKDPADSINTAIIGQNIMIGASHVYDPNDSL